MSFTNFYVKKKELLHKKHINICKKIIKIPVILFLHAHAEEEEEEV